MDENKQTPDVSSFIRLLSNHQGQIYSYILSLVGNFNDADDVLQETTTKMWELFSGFQEGTDFLRWSFAIAHYRVLEHRKKLRQLRKITYDDEFFQLVSEQAPKQLSKTNEYLEMLRRCISRLQTADATFIKMRYMEAVPVEEIASRVNKTVRSVYFSLARIHRLLMNCMGRP